MVVGYPDGLAIRVLTVESPDEESVDLPAQLASIPDRDITSRTATDIDSARAVLAESAIDCVVILHDPPEIDSVDILTALREEYPDLPVVLATETEHTEDVLRKGPTDIINLTDGQFHDSVVGNRLASIVSQSQQRSKYEEVFEQASDGIIIHDAETGEIVESNRSLYELLGYDPDEKPHLTLEDIVEDEGEFSAANAREMVQQTHREGPQTIEWLDRTADGKKRRVEVSLEPAVVSGVERVLAFVRDSTDKHEYEQELSEIRQRQSDTLARVDDAFFAVDEDWQVTYVNDAGGDVLREAMNAEYTNEELIGKHLWDEAPEAVDTKFYEQYHRAMETQESVSFESEYPPMDAWFNVRAYPDEDGLSVYFSDITERKRREQTLDSLIETTRDFIRASDRTELLDAIIDGLDDVFGYDICGVRLYDSETETLPPSRVSAKTRELIGELPVYAADEGRLGRVFHSGETTIIDNLSEKSDYDYGSIASAMCLPLGDHGLLNIGATTTDAFDAPDVALVEVVALAATEGFNRLDRETEMRQLERILTHVDQKVFLLDDAGQFTFTSQTLTDYLGRSAASLDGRPLTDVVAPEETDGCQETLARVQRDGGTERFEVRVETAGGDHRPVELELSGTHASDEAVAVAGVVTDISELEETRTDLSSERERFRELFENLPDPVVEVEFLDGEPLVHYANPAFTDVFGYDADVVQGSNLNELIVPADESAAEFDSQLRAGNQTTIEAKRETLDGTQDFLVRGIPYSRDGSTYSFAVYTDITEQKKRERYLQVLNRVLRHNLRNDVNVVMSLANVLATEIEDDDLESYATRLRDTATNIATYSEKAKEIERTVGGSNETSAVDAAATLRDVVAQQRETTPDGEFSLDIPEELWVEGSDDIERVFTELVENAVTHNDSAQPRIAIEGETMANRDGWAEIRIRDNGPGIPDTEWQVITGKEEISQLTHGSGLGLWMTRWIIESYGGEIHQQEPEGEGTTIILRLQHATPEESAWEPAEPELER